MPRLPSLLLVAAALPAFGFAPVPAPKGGKASGEEAAVRKSLAGMAGSWVQTSVKYGGEELFDPPATGHTMTFDGTSLSEFTGTGRLVLAGEMKVLKASKGVLRIDLPRKVIAAGKIRSVTVAAIACVQDVGRMQIAFIDPASAPPEGKRPDGFESTPANRVVLITLKRKP